MVSTRYAPIVCLLLAAALVPTVIHSYASIREDDGRLTTSVPATLQGFVSTPSSRDQGWGGRRFDSHDWNERRYTSGSNGVLLTIVRSYDLKKLYHHPELDIAYGTAFTSQQVVRLSDRPDMPIHVLRGTGDTAVSGAYVLEYEGGFIADPVRFQLRAVGEMLFRGRRPMTVFFARDLESHEPTQPAETLPSVMLARAAADAFAKQLTEH